MSRDEIRLSAEPGTPGHCRGCAADIQFVRTLTGRTMPMNAAARPLRLEDDHAVYRSADSHFVSCPESDRFRRR